MARPANKPNIVLLHGYAEIPEMYWLPWLHKKLEDQGYQVWSPTLPEPLKPVLKKWLKATAAQAKHWDENTIVIGHSLGGVLALRLLEKHVPRPIRAVITVGSPYASMVSFGWLIGFFDRPIAWTKVRRQARHFVAMHSKSDPLVPYDHALRYGESLGAKLVLTKNEGHFINRRAPLVWRELAKVL